MQGSDSKRSAAYWAGVYRLESAALGLGVSARPAAAAPFAYVTNNADGTVSVIDTATNLVVGSPITVGKNPNRPDVTPDGLHVYVTNNGANTVSVIATATNTVETTVTVGNGPAVAAITPDGRHVYVTNFTDNTVSVIATATNTVVALFFFSPQDDTGLWKAFSRTTSTLMEFTPAALPFISHRRHGTTMIGMRS